MVGRIALVASVSAVVVSSAFAQCTPRWSPEFDPGDPDSPITTMTWFDDGAGLRLYAAGAFKIVAGVENNGLVRWDGQQWDVISRPADFSFARLLVLPRAKGKEELVAVGSFNAARTQQAAVWGGEQFEPLPESGWSGAGAGAVRFDPDGDGPSPSLLLVSGRFTRSGEPAAQVLAWDGSTWSPVLGPPDTTTGRGLAVFDPDSDGPQRPYVALALTSGSPNTWAYTGPLDAGGSGTFVPLPQRVTTASINDLATFDADGPGGQPERLFATTSSVFSANASPLAMFDGTAWTEIEPGLRGTLNMMVVWDRDGDGPAPATLTASGGVSHSVSDPSASIATWDGAGVELIDPFDIGVGFAGSLAALPPGAPGEAGLPSLVLSRRGGVYAPDAPALSKLEMYYGQWIDVGRAPAGAPNITISAAAVWDNPADGMPQLFAWNRTLTSFGTTWTSSFANRGTFSPGGGWSDAVGQPPIGPGAVQSLIGFDPDGDGPTGRELWLTASNSGPPRGPTVFRWTGEEWAAVPDSIALTINVFNAGIAFDFDGPGPLPAQPVVGGRFDAIGLALTRNIARHDGTNWQPIGDGLAGEVIDLAVVDLDGDGPMPAELFAAGTFSGGGTPPIRGVARWNGSAWVGLPGMSSTTIQVAELEVFDADGPGPNPPTLVLAGSNIGIGQPPTRRPLWFWDGVALTAAQGFDSNDSVPATVSFDYDGPDGPAPNSLYVMSQRSPHLRRITASDWEIPEGGDVNGASSVPGLKVFDEDGPGSSAGGLYVYGNFNRAGDVPSGFIARWGCPVETPCSTDWDGNGVVNSTDVSVFINAWFNDQSEGTLVTDFDHNGVVNSTDVSSFINAWFEQSAQGC